MALQGKGRFIMQSSLVMVVVLVALAAAITAEAAAQPRPGCLTQCGNLTVPFPFGMEKDCYKESKDDTFLINCSHSTNPPTAYWGNIPVTNISLEEGELQIQMFITRDCYDQQGVRTDDSKNYSSIQTSDDFTISDTKNMFMAVGCDTRALFGGYQGEEQYMSGCTSFCQSVPNISDSCSGIGCCQTSIPSGLKNQYIELGSYYNHNYSSNCWGKHRFPHPSRHNRWKKYTKQTNKLKMTMSKYMREHTKKFTRFGKNLPTSPESHHLHYNMRKIQVQE